MSIPFAVISVRLWVRCGRANPTMMRAAAMNIPVSGIEVEIQADYDDGALFGTAPNVPPGYLEIRYAVTIDSDAPEETIIHLLDEADRHSPYLDVFRRTQTCRREVNIIAQRPH